MVPLQEGSQVAGLIHTWPGVANKRHEVRPAEFNDAQTNFSILTSRQYINNLFSV